MSDEEKGTLFRMAQSLYNQLQAQTKGSVDILPYVKQYLFLRNRLVELINEECEDFIPPLSEKLEKYHFEFSNMSRNIRAHDEIAVALNQLVSFFKTKFKESFRILTHLEEFLNSNLRKNMLKKPIEEKDVQDVIQIMLNSKGFVFEREKVQISYSNKSYKPDFTFRDLNAALEIKLCKTSKKEKDIIDEINADIPAYLTKYENVTFLVYDLGIIRDLNSFRKDIEKNNPRIKVIIIKH